MTAHPLPLAAIPLVVALAMHACSADADESWTDREVAIARLCVNESSFRAADCAAIVEARGRYSLERLRATHRRALDPARTDARRWIAELDANATEPAHWPASVSWAVRGRTAWLRLLGVVRATLRDGGRCEARPHTWGGRVVDAHHIMRLEARGYRRVDCGDTENIFLRRGTR